MVVFMCQLSAQESPTSPDGKQVSKGASVRLCVWGDWKGKELFIKKIKRSDSSEEKYLKVDLLNMGYSPIISFNRKKLLKLCSREEIDGELVFRPFLQIKIPSTIKVPLVLLFPDKKGGATYRIFDLDPAKFPYGGYQIVNLSKLPLLAKLDKKGVKLKPGSAHQLKGGSKDGQKMWLRVVTASGKNKNKLVYSSMLKNRKAKRMFLFFHPSNKKRGVSVGVKTLIDYVPVKESKVTSR